MNTETTSAAQQFVMILVQEAITIAVPILLTLLGLALNEGRKLFKRHASASKIALLEEIVRVAVQAAEKSGLTGAILKEGAAKKSYAISEAQRILNERGMTGISVATISTYIEAALQQGMEGGFLEGLEGPAVELDIDSLSPQEAQALYNQLQSKLSTAPTEELADINLPWKNTDPNR